MKFTKDSIAINTSKEKLWEVLVSPTYTKEYMYTCEATSDWEIGSPLLWIGCHDQVTYVKGTILDLDIYNMLVYSIIDPNGNYEDIPNNYLQVTYELKEEKDHIILTVSQGDYSIVANGFARYAEAQSQGGWSSILTVIKEIAER